MTGVLSILLGDNAAPVASGSGWGDHGTFFDLSTTSITNDTAELNTTSNQHCIVRGARGYISGKHYFEVKLLTAPAADAYFIGLMDAATPTGSSMDVDTNINMCWSYGNDGTGVVNGSGMSAVNIGAAFSNSTNDIMGVALDFDNGFHYLAKNNVWFLSGVPTSGSSGTGHIGAYTGTALTRVYYPMIKLWGLTHGKVQLITGAGALTYSPPTGGGNDYTAWG